MDRFEQLTAKYLDEVLAPVEVQELANHLRADPEAIRQLLMLYSQDRLLVDLHRSEDLGAVELIMAEIRGEERAFVGSVMQRVREEQDSRGLMDLPGAQTWLQNVWRSWLVWTASAATLAIALYLSLFRPVVGQPVLLVSQASSMTIERGGENVPASARLILQPNDVLTVMGTNTASITYTPENTRLDLKPGTTVKLLDWARGKRLELRLGQVEASVARQRTFKPLLVRTPQAEARVLGTRFTLAIAANRTSLEVSEGKVRLTRESDGNYVDVAKDHSAIAGTGVELAALPQTGELLREVWSSIRGERINHLLYHPDYPDRPAARDFVKSFETDEVRTNDFGCRLVGYIHPPVTGKYTFWIAGAADMVLWLSRNENPAEKVRIATAADNAMSTPQSAPITLVAGRRYFIQAVQKIGRGSSHLAVSWQPPGGEREVIPGQFLSPLEPKK